MPADEHYFGLGDKTGAFDHREAAFRLWNTDAYGWQESTDPLYKSIPFYLTYRAGVSLGVLIDNTWPASFDFGKTVGDTVQYRAEGGPANIYILYGPSAKEVLKSYAWLTGPTPLPPAMDAGLSAIALQLHDAGAGARGGGATAERQDSFGCRVSRH